MIKPILDWVMFDYKNPPADLNPDEDSYLILIADYGYQPTEKTIPEYYTDIATAYGSYLDGFWNTTNDWNEGQILHVVGYCSIGEQVKLEKQIQIAYLCDGHSCNPEQCNANVDCRHTLDISHAQSFDEVDTGKYMEHDYTVYEGTEGEIPND